MRLFSRGRCWLALTGLLLASPQATLADAFVDKANEMASATPGTKRAQDVLFPALAKMRTPPMDLNSNEGVREMLMLTPDDGEWQRMARWAQREPQQKALEALRAISGPDDLYIIGIPYGSEGLDDAWIDAGLYVELGPSNLLAGAQFYYFEKLEHLFGLAMFEGARLASEGEGAEALAVLIDAMFLGRIVTERAFAEEVQQGLWFMLTASERIRDVVYLFIDNFTVEDLVQASERLDPAFGDMQLAQIPFPEADRVAIEQIVDWGFVERRGVIPDKLAQAMAEVRSSDRPLRRFSEAAYWRELVEQHPDFFDTSDRITEVFGDWRKRWAVINQFDPIHQFPTDFRQLDGSQYPILYYLLSEPDQLYDMRLELLVDSRGTFNSLGVAAFRARENRWPPNLSSVAPGYIRTTAPDPWHLDRRLANIRSNAAFQPFEYFVPIRDQRRNRREDPTPHPVTIIYQEGLTPEMIGGGMGDMGADFGGDFEGDFDGGGMGMGFDPSMFGAGGFDMLGNASMDDIPDDVFDPETFTVDVRRLREYLIDDIQTAPVTREDLDSLRSDLQELIDDNVTAANVRDKLAEALEELRSDPMAMGMVEGFGIDVDEMEGLLGDLGEELLSDRSIQRVIDTVRDGGDIAEQDARDAAEAMVSIAVDEKYIDPIMETVKSAMEAMGSMMADMGMAGSDAGFTAFIDDSQFILYSRGWDEIDGEALSVGPQGSDILIWPPLISLEREAGR
ncbi:MAG: hypothetical protein AAFX05_13065 [Planctomycetota bacterium]